MAVFTSGETGGSTHAAGAGGVAARATAPGAKTRSAAGARRLQRAADIDGGLVMAGALEGLGNATPMDAAGDRIKP
jgi:hypothetical protein